jgi:hypothetical protein
MIPFRDTVPSRYPPVVTWLGDCENVRAPRRPPMTSRRSSVALAGGVLADVGAIALLINVAWIRALGLLTPLGVVEFYLLRR